MSLPKLHVGEDHRTIYTDSGSPFFYLADTAWSLFQRLTLADAYLYFQTRTRQGFNAYQVVAISELDGLNKPNRSGDLPFESHNPLQPVEKYWQHVDQVIATAAQAGLYTALLPTWGDKINKKWGAGPEIFTLDNSRAYGAWIANRYRNQPIIWVLGGDRPLENDHHRGVVREMAEGIRSVVGKSQLLTFHPTGGTSSSSCVHDEEWLDFHCLQSGHTGYDNPNWQMIKSDRALSPTRPVLDSEPNYENHPVMGVVNGQWKPTGTWFDDHDIRKSFWRSVLAGACGYTYGCHDMWQFFDLQQPNPPINFARTLWREALTLPGANQLRAAKQFVEPLMPLTPMEVRNLDHPASAAGHAVAAVSNDHGTMLIYLPQAGRYEVDLPHKCLKEDVSAYFPARLPLNAYSEIAELEVDGTDRLSLVFTGDTTPDLLLKIVTSQN